MLVWLRGWARLAGIASTAFCIPFRPPMRSRLSSLPSLHPHSCRKPSPLQPAPKDSRTHDDLVLHPLISLQPDRTVLHPGLLELREGVEADDGGEVGRRWVWPVVGRTALQNLAVSNQADRAVESTARVEVDEKDATDFGQKRSKLTLLLPLFFTL